MMLNKLSLAVFHFVEAIYRPTQCNLSHLSPAPVDLHRAVAVIVVCVVSVPLSRDLGAEEPAISDSFKMQSYDQRRQSPQHVL